MQKKKIRLESFPEILRAKVWRFTAGSAWKGEVTGFCTVVKPLLSMCDIWWESDTFDERSEQCNGSGFASSSWQGESHSFESVSELLASVLRLGSPQDASQDRRVQILRMS